MHHHGEPFATTQQHGCSEFLLRLHPFHHHLPSRPPLFVDCCFKRRKKPLLPTMVSSLSSRPSALVGCFCCPPQPTLAASHGSRRQLSVALTADNSTSPSPCPPPRRSDAAGIPPPLRSLPNSRGATRGSALRSSELSRRDSRLCPMILRLLGEGQRAIAVVATANARLRVVVSWFDGGGSCTASISMGEGSCTARCVSFRRPKQANQPLRRQTQPWAPCARP